MSPFKTFQTSSKGGTVNFELICQLEHLVFQVQDQGIGIPQTELSQLFDTFHRASNVGTIPGTGLGLAIVKKSVEAHQGQITVESEIGVGTTFQVTLPLYEVCPTKDSYQ
ncbi:sensor histidine kinase [Scytonema millei]|uniref:histidine kinase n=1 Tax=Scytonema millei VB511283 TaxID=1245923 RepID=A0A9X5E5H8_9CYAN|nr:sensor histidine kinase [Scytonema millei]NHC34377.1 sensor histidine kinase [Scytonema millei VB511283]